MLESTTFWQRQRYDFGNIEPRPLRWQWCKIVAECSIKEGPLDCSQWDKHPIYCTIYIRRCPSESMKAFEIRIIGKNAKFSYISSTTKIIELLLAFFALYNSHGDGWQRGSILAAASLSFDILEKDPTIDVCFEIVTYESFSSVIRQCNKQNNDIKIQVNYSSTLKCIFGVPWTCNQRTRNGSND